MIWAHPLELEKVRITGNAAYTKIKGGGTFKLVKTDDGWRIADLGG